MQLDAKSSGIQYGETFPNRRSPIVSGGSDDLSAIDVSAIAELRFTFSSYLVN